MNTPTRNDRVMMSGAFLVFLLVVYAGLYGALRGASWIDTVGYIDDRTVTVTIYGIRADNKVAWIEWPFLPAIRLEELLRGYPGEPDEWRSLRQRSLER